MAVVGGVESLWRSQVKSMRGQESNKRSSASRVFMAIARSEYDARESGNLDNGEGQSRGDGGPLCCRVRRKGLSEREARSDFWINSQTAANRMHQPTDKETAKYQTNALLFTAV